MKENERFRRTGRILILVLVLVGGLVPLVSADENETVISFSNVNMLKNDDFEVYGLSPNGTWSLLGLYNFTSSGITFTPGVYQIAVRPRSADLISTPELALDSISDFARTNLVALIIGAFILGIIIWRR